MSFINNKMPKPRVLSSSAELILVSSANQSEISIGEVDHFTFKKAFKQIKRWKPYGNKTEQILIEDQGWDIDFSGGKVDWNLAYLFYANEVALGGNFGDVSTNPKNPTAEDFGSLYNTPLFEILRTVKHYDGSIEQFRFKDVALLDYEEQGSENAAVISEKMSAWSPRREMVIVNGSATLNSDISKINNVVKTILDVLLTNGR